MGLKSDQIIKGALDINDIFFWLNFIYHVTLIDTLQI